MSNDVWIDYLDVINLCKFLNKKKVCYIGSSKIVQTLIKNFNLNQFQKIPTISQSSNQINGLSLYEYIQGQTTSLLQSFTNSSQIQNHIYKFEVKFKINPIKLKTYFQEKFFYTSYRYNELLAYHTFNQSDADIYLQHSVISSSLPNQEKNIIFYKKNSLHFLKKHHTREDYFYDRFQEDYFFDPTKATFRLLLKEFSGALSLLISVILLKKNIFTTPRIGIEINRPTVDPNECNDLYWAFEEPLPQNKFVYFNQGIENKKTLDFLKKTGVPVFKTTQNIVKVIQAILQKNKNEIYIYPSSKYILSFIKLIPQYISNLLFNSSEKEITFYSLLYVTRSLYFYYLYTGINLKILWTMLDTDLDKLTKGQGIEWSNGLYCGAHWSITDFFRVDNQKTYDIILTWGKHFIKNNFTHFPLQKPIIVGYPSDHYFKTKKILAASLKEKYKGKFIISYHDNEVYNDLPNDIDSQKNILNLFVRLLNKNEQLILLCKPKNKKRFDLVSKEVPFFEQLYLENRIVFFIGTPPEPKYSPATVGLISDIAVGLGLSTASAECQFAGTLGLHYDSCNFQNNYFATLAKDKFVFSQISSLEATLQNFISNPSELRKYYKLAQEAYHCINENNEHTTSKETHKIVMNLYYRILSGEKRNEILNKI